jgi:hypothetical protein
MREEGRDGGCTWYSNMKRILRISSPTEVYKQLMSKPQLVSMRNKKCGLMMFRPHGFVFFLSLLKDAGELAPFQRNHCWRVQPAQVLGGGFSVCMQFLHLLNGGWKWPWKSDMQEISTPLPS